MPRIPTCAYSILNLVSVPTVSSGWSPTQCFIKTTTRFSSSRHAQQGTSCPTSALAIFAVYFTAALPPSRVHHRACRPRLFAHFTHALEGSKTSPYHQLICRDLHSPCRRSCLPAQSDCATPGQRFSDAFLVSKRSLCSVVASTLPPGSYHPAKCNQRYPAARQSASPESWHWNRRSLSLYPLPSRILRPDTQEKASRI